MTDSNLTVTETLQQRGSNYGDFESQARIVQSLKCVAYEQCKVTLEEFHNEALDMIFHKIARILNGNPNHIDSWHDIAGYATLAEQIISRRQPQLF